MRRLKNVHPSDLIAYPLGTGNFAVGAADPGSKIVMYNESPLNIVLDFYNGNTDTLHAWEANVWVLDGDTPQIQWAIDADSISATTPPISAIFLTLYGAKEQVAGTYPTNLFRQANIGNTGGISTTVSSTNAIANDGNAAGTSIIESTVLGHTGTNILTNDGLLNLVTLIGASLVQLIKTQNTGNPLLLGAASTITEVLGNLQVDGTISASGNISGATLTSSGDITGNGTLHKFNTITDTNDNNYLAVTASTVTRIASGGTVAIQVPGGSTVASINSSGLGVTGTIAASSGITANSYTLTGASNYAGYTGSFSRIAWPTGTGTVTVNHGLGATPTGVMVTCSANGGSQTEGVAFNATQIIVTSGNTLTWQALAWRN